MKDLLIKLGANVWGPSAVRGAVLGAVGWIAAKQGYLAPWGIISDQAHHLITIHTDQVTAKAIASIPGAIALVIKAFQFHGTNAVKAIVQKGGSNA